MSGGAPTRNPLAPVIEPGPMNSANINKEWLEKQAALISADRKTPFVSKEPPVPQGTGDVQTPLLPEEGKPLLPKPSRSHALGVRKNAVTRWCENTSTCNKIAIAVGAAVLVGGLTALGLWLGGVFGHADTTPPADFSARGNHTDSAPSGTLVTWMAETQLLGGENDVVTNSTLINFIGTAGSATAIAGNCTIFIDNRTITILSVDTPVEIDISKPSRQELEDTIKGASVVCYNTNLTTWAEFAQGTAVAGPVRSSLINTPASPTPSATPSIAPSTSQTSTPSIGASSSTTPSFTPSPTVTSSPAVTPTVTSSPSVTPSVTLSPTVTPSATPSSSASQTPAPVQETIIYTGPQNIECYQGIGCPPIINSYIGGTANNGTTTVNFTANLNPTSTGTNSVTVNFKNGTAFLTVSPANPSITTSLTWPNPWNATNALNGLSITASQATNGVADYDLTSQVYQPPVDGSPAQISNAETSSVTVNQASAPCATPIITTTTGETAGGQTKKLMIGCTINDIVGIWNWILTFDPMKVKFIECPINFDCTTPGTYTAFGLSGAQIQTSIQGASGSVGGGAIIGEAVEITLTLEAAGPCPEKESVVARWTRTSLATPFLNANTDKAASLALEPAA
ncbi:MAG: hypothetical protein Q7V63_09905 [Gammaproteobacteria bacterium]|nr:hypothetical protein [Gammaproteobacteria bacterium]